MSATPPIASLAPQAPVPFREAPTVQSPLAERQGSFAAALGRELTGGNAAAVTPEQRARDGAEQFVSAAFVLPLLKQLRESNHAPPPFSPSEGEKQFGALADAELARRIVHAARFPLVDRLARDLLKKGGKDGQGRDANEALRESRTSIPQRAQGVPLSADRR